MLRKYRPALSKIIPIAIVIFVLLSYRDILRGLIIVPVAYIFFIFRLISSSIHQEVLWVSFVVISSLIALISLGMRWEPAVEEIPVANKYPTRLKTWQHSVKDNQRSDYFKWNLAHDMSDLVVKAIANREGISRAQVLRRLYANQLDLPPDITAYLQIAQKPYTQNGFSQRANDHWLVRFREKWTRGPVPSRIRPKTPLDLEPDRMIRYLEEYLDLDPEIWVE